MKNTLYVNFFGGPGIGKSTMMAHCFAELKWKNFDCEMATEYAKEKVWEESKYVLQNKLYVTVNQLHRLQMLNGKVDVVLTDSPLILGIFYGNPEPPEFNTLILKHFNSFNNLNFILKRSKEFKQNGRIHDEEQSKKVDDEIINFMNIHNIESYAVCGDKENVSRIVNIIINKL